MTTNQAHAVGYVIGRAIVVGLIFWACWDIPRPYFCPAAIALIFLSKIGAGVSK